MSNKLDYINMIKKVSPYNVKKLEIHLFVIMEPEDSGLN